MSTFVVRHVKAGSRSRWSGDDRERPVSASGRQQADGIAERLADAGVRGLWSSPYRRCVETLEPLAARLGLALLTDRRLGEGARTADVLALLAEAGDGAVLCSHGDVIPDLLDALVRRGTVVTTEPDWRKGAIWVLERDGDDGGFATARAEAPPT